MTQNAKIVPAAWLQDGWIYSSQDEQNGRFWIHDNWIWGPVGAADTNTGFYIADGWIYGPAFKLPFV